MSFPDTDTSDQTKWLEDMFELLAGSESCGEPPAAASPATPATAAAFINMESKDSDSSGQETPKVASAPKPDPQTQTLTTRMPPTVQARSTSSKRVRKKTPRKRAKTEILSLRGEIGDLVTHLALLQQVRSQQLRQNPPPAVSSSSTSNSTKHERSDREGGTQQASTSRGTEQKAEKKHH